MQVLTHLFFDAVNRLGNDRAVACQILTLFYNYWCPLKIFGDFWDFYFLGQPIYRTYKSTLSCCKMTEYVSK